MYYFINKLYCTICYLIKTIKGRPKISNARYLHYLEPMYGALATQAQLALNRFLHTHTNLYLKSHQGQWA